MKLFAVTGNPILFSKSPTLHRFWLKENGIKAAYTRLSAETTLEALELAKELGISGINVTAPFKESFISLLDQVDENSRKIGAVNTILLTDPVTKGMNTDPIGIRYALRDIPLNKASVCILGNGGAAKSVKIALNESGALISALARTVRDGELLLFSEEARIAFESADIIISTIPADAVLPEYWKFKTSAVLLDAIYSSTSAVTQKAIAQHVKVISGIYWLAGQGFASFNLFNGLSAVNSSQEVSIPEVKSDKKNIFFLIGMMGAGKSAALKALADLGYRTCDLDSKIEEKAEKKIAQIISSESEAAFRRLEHEALEDILKNSDTFDIIACGGGTPTFANNTELLSQGTVIWIWCDPKIIAQRLKDDGARPLLAGKDIEKTLTDLLEARFESYASISDIVINSRTRTPNDLADRIHYEISSTRKL